MIQEVEYPIDKLVDDEFRELEKVPPFTELENFSFFGNDSWVGYNGVFIGPIIFCIKDHIDKVNGTFYSNSIAPIKEGKRVCEFLGKAQIVPSKTLEKYVNELFDTGGDYNPTRPPFSFKDNFNFACNDCLKQWLRYNPTRPPMGYNPTMPPIHFPESQNPTRPPPSQNL